MENHYFLRVYDLVRNIPSGKVCTYGIIADHLALGSARMVGWALNKCKMNDGVPAHRVVNRKGELSGRNSFPSPNWMEEMLDAEGVEVDENKVVNLERYLWKPDKTF